MNVSEKSRGSDVEMKNDMEIAYQLKAGTPYGVQTTEEVAVDFGCIQGRFSDKEIINGCVGGRAYYNNVFHSRNNPFKVVVPAFESDPVNWSAADYIMRRHGMRLPEWRTDYSACNHLGGSFSFPSHTMDAVDWSQLVTTVGASLDGRMLGRTNILVTIGEMGKTIRMLKNPFGILSRLKRVPPQLTMRQLAKDQANLFLEYTYGWRQLYRDISDLATVYEKARKHVEYLNKSSGSWDPIAKSRTDSQSYSVPNPTIDNGLDALSFELIPTSVTRTATFSLNILRGSGFEVLSAEKYARQSLGVGKLVEALWDLLPWSFVIDWFIDIGRLVAMNPYFKMNHHQLRFVGHSEKLTYRAALHIASRWMVEDQFGDNIEMVYDFPEQVVHSVYTRTAGFPPDTTSQGVFGRFSIRNVSSASALIAQRL
jgi:hypothetical protein